MAEKEGHIVRGVSGYTTRHSGGTLNQSPVVTVVILVTVQVH